MKLIFPKQRKDKFSSLAFGPICLLNCTDKVAEKMIANKFLAENKTKKIMSSS